jgi:putative transposase
LAVSCASVYRRPAEISEKDCTMVALIDRQYPARPYYGSRRMAAWLATQGHVVNRKRVRRLMRLARLAAIYQRPNTSKPGIAHKIYPYLLGGLSIERVNQVWCSDITFIPIAKGCLYELRRVCRRSFCLRPTRQCRSAQAGLNRASASAGGRFPIGWRRRRVLAQSTHSRVTNSTASKLRQRPRRWITSVLKPV